jgi:hypothetical protein
MVEKPKKATRGPAKKTLEKNAAAQKVSEEQILEVFEFWKLTFKRRSLAVLDHQRKVLIGSAIYHYGIDGAKDAIIGCTRSDFWMGRNKRNKAYNGIEHIFKDNARIEAMLEMVPKEDLNEDGVNW